MNIILYSGKVKPTLQIFSNHILSLDEHQTSKQRNSFNINFLEYTDFRIEGSLY